MTRTSRDLLVLVLSITPAAPSFAECVAPIVNSSSSEFLDSVYDDSSLSGRNQSSFDLDSIRYEDVLATGCAEKVDLSNLLNGEYSAALHSGVSMNLFLDLIDERAESGLTSTSGRDEQVVEPDAAIRTFGASFGASSWQSRVEAADPQVREGKSACQIAIEALKAVACASQRDLDCDIEQSFRDRCTQSSDRAELGLCVISADTYFYKCFGNDPMPYGVERSMIPACDGEDRFCSGGLAGDDYDRRIVLTATHCQSNRIGFGLPANDPQLCREWQGRWGPSSAGDTTSYDAQSLGGEGSYLTIAAPELFAPTFLGGVSYLVQLRNQAAERYNRGGSEVPSLPPSFQIYRSDTIWDNSALCTIVENSGSSLKHTCQSSRGTSGGPLVQYIDGAPRLVGINLGANDSTSGAYNMGTVLFSLNHLFQ